MTPILITQSSHNFANCSHAIPQTSKWLDKVTVDEHHAKLDSLKPGNTGMCQWTWFKLCLVTCIVPSHYLHQRAVPINWENISPLHLYSPYPEIFNKVFLFPTSQWFTGKILATRWQKFYGRNMKMNRGQETNTHMGKKKQVSNELSKNFPAHTCIWPPEGQNWSYEPENV